MHAIFFVHLLPFAHVRIRNYIIIQYLGESFGIHFWLSFSQKQFLQRFPSDSIYHARRFISYYLYIHLCRKRRNTFIFSGFKDRYNIKPI